MRTPFRSLAVWALYRPGQVAKLADAGDPTMSEATVFESRVSKLEQDNRRLKLTVGALLLALAAVPLIGAVTPEQIPEVIRARAFHAIDGNGTVV